MQLPGARRAVCVRYALGVGQAEVHVPSWVSVEEALAALQPVLEGYEKRSKLGPPHRLIARPFFLRSLPVSPSLSLLLSFYVHVPGV